ncbi:MAG: redox-sensitive transcriptional activator SoxR [Psychrobium sp.]
MALKEELSVGEVAKRTGVAISALHFYENKGLITSFRDKANHRRYNRDVLRIISVIKVAQESGIQLQEIKSALEALPNKKRISVCDWNKLSNAWRDQLQQRIDQLSTLKNNLDNCIGCGCLSMEKCRLVNPKDVLSEHGPGPHFAPDENT